MAAKLLQLFSRIDKRRRVKMTIHIIVILLLFILPDLIFSLSMPHWRVETNHLIVIYVKASIYVGVFYTSYYLLIKRTLLAQPRRRIVAFALGALAIILVALVALNITQAWLLPWRPRNWEPTAMAMLLRRTSWILRELGLLALVISLSVAIRLGENWAHMEQRHEQMLASQKTEELESLKNQLNPHFLFNTLNTIYALIAISPAKAQDAVHELSTLLRHVLYENPEKVRLNQEVKFVQSYISLMEMRLGEGLVKVDFRIAADVEVAPLLFISLVENAFKHGNTGRKDQPIKIEISSTPEGEVVCKTANHFLPRQQASAGGIGIANLRRRLHLIYGNRASLQTEASEDFFTSILTIKP